MKNDEVIILNRDDLTTHNNKHFSDIEYYDFDFNENKSWYAPKQFCTKNK